jgi:hypothetical protein
MAIEHQEFLEELLQVLTDEESESKTPEEIMGEVVSIVDDYKSELDLEEAENEERDKLSMMGINPDVEDEESETPDTIVSIPKPINRAFLLTKAQKDYYRNLGLTDEDIDNFTPSEKVKHRKGVTDLFNSLVKAEQEKPEEPSRYAKGPFKKIAGSISVNRKIEEDEDEESDDEEITPAQINWKKQQTKEIKAGIRAVTVEIDELKRQNKIKKISPLIINRNNERIAELEDELEALEEQQNQYK